MWTSKRLWWELRPTGHFYKMFLYLCKLYLYQQYKLSRILLQLWLRIWWLSSFFSLFSVPYRSFPIIESQLWRSFESSLQYRWDQLPSKEHRGQFQGSREDTDPWLDSLSRSKTLRLIDRKVQLHRRDWLKVFHLVAHLIEHRSSIFLLIKPQDSSLPKQAGHLPYSYRNHHIKESRLDLRHLYSDR